MKKTIILVLIALGFGLGWYGQYQPHPNLWLSCAAVIIFMMGMMWLSGKTPSKHKDDEQV